MLYLAPSLLALALALAPPAAAQSTWFVDDDGSAPGTGTAADPYTSVAFALAQPATLSGDTVEVAAGLYLDETIDFLGKEVTVRGVAGPAATRIVAPAPPAGAFSVVRFASGEGPGARLEGVTLSGGLGDLDSTIFGSPASTGGGLFCAGASPTLVNVVLESNQGAIVGGGAFFSQSSATLTGCSVRQNGNINHFMLGAGIYAHESDLVLVDSVIEGNVSDGQGGGLYLDGGTLLLEGCQVRDNRTGFGSGAGCYTESGTLTVREAEFAGNQSGDNGAGIYAAGGGPVVIESSVLEGNFANNGDPYSGGALYMRPNVPLVVTDCVFRSNLGQLGGAVEAGNAATFESCLFVDNAATGGGQFTSFGGALSGGAGTVVRRSVFLGNRSIDAFTAGGGAVYGNVRLEHCTLVGNLSGAGLGGGARFAELENCIVSGNGSGDLPGALNNLADAVASYSLVGGGWPGLGNQLGDPQFWDELGGDVRLRPGSAAIDSGNPQSPADPDGTRADMGRFPFEQAYCGAHCDGALGTAYCAATINSTGLPATIQAAGNPSLADNLMVLAANGLPPGQPGYFLTSQSQAFVPMLGGGQGNLCLGGSIVRFVDEVLIASTAGAATRMLDVANSPGGADFLPGATWNFQYWFRDVNPAPTSNTTPGLEVTWQ